MKPLTYLYVLELALVASFPLALQARDTTSTGSWDSQNSYWRNQYPSRPYHSADRDYSAYEPAYRYGYDLYNRNSGRSFDQLNQNDLRRGWEGQARRDSALNWSDAQKATRDSYNRMANNRRDASDTTGPAPNALAPSTGSTMPQGGIGSSGGSAPHAAR